MNETAINHAIKHQSSTFDSLKSLASSKKNVPDDTSVQSSFDTYFSKKNISKETQKPDRQEKSNSFQSKNTALHKKNVPLKNDSTVKTETQKQVSSSDNRKHTNDTEAEASDNNPISETKKEDSQTETIDTKDTEETIANPVNIFLIDVTQTPLSTHLTENQSDIGLIELENQTALNPYALQIPTLNTPQTPTLNTRQTPVLTDISDIILIENNGFNLEQDISDISDDDLLTKSTRNDDELSLLASTDNRNKDSTLIDSFLANNSNNANNTGDKSTGNQPATQTVTGLNFYNNTPIIPQINIQKSSQPEVIAQIPLQNDLSLNITKDSDNPNKIGINLEPAGMGDVELVIENNKDNSVIAIIRSDNPEILEQLRKETASLERYLSEAGLNLGGNGLGFEHKSHDDTNKKKNSSNDMLTASISETTFGNHNNRLMNATEQLYATLDRQSIQAGLDIRL